MFLEPNCRPIVTENHIGLTSSPHDEFPASVGLTLRTDLIAKQGPIAQASEN